MRFLRLPLRLAWQAFGEANGVHSQAEMRTRIAKYRRQPIGPDDDPYIGCILLEEPFFLQEADWIPAPPDFSPNIVAGKGYGLDTDAGAAIYRQVGERLSQPTVAGIPTSPALTAVADAARFGKPVLVNPRLGQGSFRVLVTDAYDNRCAMTGERTRPVLQAAHIRPYAQDGEHRLDNGLLLRSDLHTLFDEGYLTIGPDDRRIVVSKRIREEFENGRAYYALHGLRIADPVKPEYAPSRENLLYHAQSVFRS